MTENEEEKANRLIELLNEMCAALRVKDFKDINPALVAKQKEMSDLRRYTDSLQEALNKRQH